MYAASLGYQIQENEINMGKYSQKVEKDGKTEWMSGNLSCLYFTGGMGVCN